MLTKKVKDEILVNLGIMWKLKKIPSKIVFDIITLTEQAIIEGILEETQYVEPTLVRKYIEEQLYLPYFKKQK